MFRVIGVILFGVVIKLTIWKMMQHAAKSRIVELEKKSSS